MAIFNNFEDLTPDKQKEVYNEIKSIFEGVFLRELENHKIEADDSLSGKGNQFGYDWKVALGLAVIVLGVGGITTGINGIPSAATNSTGSGNSNDGVDPKYILLILLAIVGMAYTLASITIVPVKSGLAYTDEKPINARKRETYVVDDFVKFAEKLSTYVQEKTKPSVASTPSQTMTANLPPVAANNDALRLATLDSDESDNNYSSVRFSRSSGSGSE